MHTKPDVSSHISTELTSMSRNRILGKFGGGGTVVRLNSNSGSVVLAQF
ncbi:MAG TPA: hypothetical protein VHP63_07460 [candidate division Zixibacteria bacterium]|nr:hypothetical protein [candidate division Zixibacteria bacterium]